MELVKTKSDTARMTLRLDASLMARLNEYHKATDIPKTRIINKALQNYLDELEGESEADFLEAQSIMNEVQSGKQRLIPASEVYEKAGI